MDIRFLFLCFKKLKYIKDLSKYTFLFISSRPTDRPTTHTREGRDIRMKR